MTQAQKRLFAGLKRAEQRAEFVQMLREKQALMGRYEGWETAYAEKCREVAEGDSFPQSSVAPPPVDDDPAPKA